jgi:hypothetical protein
MAGASELLSRAMGQVRTAGRAILGVVTLWGVLAGLGLLPTAAAVIAFVSSAANHEPSSWLGAVLIASLFVNLLLAFLAIRGWRYARALESDMELIGRMMRERREPGPPWVPNNAGVLPVTNATLEEMFERGTAVAREQVASDAQLGVGWITLSRPLVSFNGFSPGGQKRFRVWCVPGQLPALVHVERRTDSVYPIEDPHWRRDATWPELILRSWAVESPFEGDVTLWPRHEQYRQVRVGEGLWEIEYAPVHDGVRGKGTRYVLAGGELQRVGRPSPIPPAPLTPGASSDR